LIILRGIYGKPQERALPDHGGQRTVEEKPFRMAVKVGAYVFPFRRGSRFPFRPEQGLGGDRFYPGPVGKAAVPGIVRVPLHPLLVYGRSGIGKYKGIIPGGPDDPVRGKTPNNLSVTAQNIFLGAGNQLKSPRVCQGKKLPETILRAGQDMEIAGKGF
jgi:hypothetical protein